MEHIYLDVFFGDWKIILDVCFEYEYDSDPYYLVMDVKVKSYSDFEYDREPYYHIKCEQ